MGALFSENWQNREYIFKKSTDHIKKKQTKYNNLIRSCVS